MAKVPTVTNELVDLVETMRQTQLHYEKLINTRDQYVSQHQVRRAEQAKKAAEDRVDLWTVSYRAEMKKYLQMAKALRTDELPGFYSAKKVD